MSKRTVRVGTGTALVWPQVCVLCLGAATQEDTELILGKPIPYCDACHARVERLRGWGGSTFMIALIIGVIAAAYFLIRTGATEGWLELVRVQTWVYVGAAGAIIGGVFYVIIWLPLLFLRLIMPSRVAKPGVKIGKSKEPGVTVLQFSNKEYANRFREANGLE